MSLNGPGPQLFTVHFWHPGYMTYMPPDETGERDLQTPPPYLMRGIPDGLHEQLNKYGDNANNWDLLEEAGVEELHWRQPLRHLEVNYWSEDVYSAMKELIGEQLSHSRSFVFSHHLSPSRRYYQFRIERWPGKLLRDGQWVLPWFVPELCNPAFESAVARLLAPAVSQIDGEVEFALPAWLHRESKILSFRSGYAVTEEFVERWRSTEVSQHLRKQNWESDLDFAPTNLGFKGQRVNYRWVDVEPPEELEL